MDVFTNIHTGLADLRQAGGTLLPAGAQVAREVSGLEPIASFASEGKSAFGRAALSGGQSFQSDWLALLRQGALPAADKKAENGKGAAGAGGGASETGESGCARCERDRATDPARPSSAGQAEKPPTVAGRAVWGGGMARSRSPVREQGMVNSWRSADGFAAQTAVEGAKQPACAGVGKASSRARPVHESKHGAEKGDSSAPSATQQPVAPGGITGEAPIAMAVNPAAPAPGAQTQRTAEDSPVAPAGDHAGRSMDRAPGIRSGGFATEEAAISTPANLAFRSATSPAHAAKATGMPEKTSSTLRAAGTSRAAVTRAEAEGDGPIAGQEAVLSKTGPCETESPVGATGAALANGTAALRATGVRRDETPGQHPVGAAAQTAVGDAAHHAATKSFSGLAPSENPAAGAERERLGGSKLAPEETTNLTPHASGTSQMRGASPHSVATQPAATATQASVWVHGSAAIRAASAATDGHEHEAGSEALYGPESGPESQAREAFAAADAGTQVGAPSWIQAGPRRAEAGFEDPALGWVGVRADLSGGAVHASLVPSSAEAAQVLGEHLKGLSDYLAQQRTPVAMLTLDASGGGSVGNGAGHQTQNGAGQSAGGGGSAETEAHLQGRSPAVVQASALRLAGDPSGFETLTEGGGSRGVHISVMA